MGEGLRRDNDQLATLSSLVDELRKREMENEREIATKVKAHVQAAKLDDDLSWQINQDMSKMEHKTDQWYNNEDRLNEERLRLTQLQTEIKENLDKNQYMLNKTISVEAFNTVGRAQRLQRSFTNLVTAFYSDTKDLFQPQEKPMFEDYVGPLKVDILQQGGNILSAVQREMAPFLRCTAHTTCPINSYCSTSNSSCEPCQMCCDKKDGFANSCGSCQCSENTSIFRSIF